MSSYGRKDRHRGARLLAVVFYYLWPAYLSIHIALSAPLARATEGSRLDSPFALRQEAFQSALRHSSQPADIQNTLSLYRSAIEKSAQEYGANAGYTAQLYYELGSYALDNSKFTLALESLNRAVELDPNSIAARLKLIGLYEICAKPKEARKQISQILARHPDSTEGRRLLVCAIQKHDPAAATRQAFRIDRLICPSPSPPVDSSQVSAQVSTAVTTKDDGLKQTKNAALKPESARDTGLAIVKSAMSLRALHSAKVNNGAKNKSEATTTRQSPANKQGVELVAKVKPPKPTSPAKQRKISALLRDKVVHADRKSGRHVQKKMEDKLDHLVPDSVCVEATENPESGNGIGAEIQKKEKPARRARALKASGKVAKGLVPPPPPTPFLPAFPGMVPALHPPGFMPSAELKTEAKLKNSTSKRNEKGEFNIKSDAKEDKAAAKEEKSRPAGKLPTGESTTGAKDSGDSDPDFLLKWANVNKKKK